MRRFTVYAKKQIAAPEGTDAEHAYVKDKLGKVSMMLDDANRKLEDAQNLYDKTSDSEPHPKSDYAEGASAAIGYAQKQIDFIDDRIDDYLDDYNLKFL
jgi:hypothetical protein